MKRSTCKMYNKLIICNATPVPKGAKKVYPKWLSLDEIKKINIWSENTQKDFHYQGSKEHIAKKQVKLNYEKH